MEHCLNSFSQESAQNHLVETCNVYQHLDTSPALRSRRSLRSLARYARSTILKIFLYVVDAKSRSKISEILSKLLPKSIQNPPKFVPKSIQNRIQIDLGSVLASELHFSSIFDASWVAPGAVLARLGRQVGSKLATKSQQQIILKLV